MKRIYITEHAQDLINYLVKQCKYLFILPSAPTIWESIQASDYKYLAADNKLRIFKWQWAYVAGPMLENIKDRSIDFEKIEQDLIRYEYLTNSMASDSKQDTRLKRIALFFFINCPFYVRLPSYSVMLSAIEKLQPLLYLYNSRTMRNNYTEITKHFNNIRENYGNNKAC